MGRKSESSKSTSSAPTPRKSKSTPSGTVVPKSMVCAIPSKEKTTEGGYEVVHPPSSSRINSLSDRTKGWWRRKNKRQRQITVVQLAGTLTMIAVILIILIVIGGWFLYEYGRWKRAVDERLTTRTQVCREYYKNDPQAECMYEDWAQRPNCSSKLQCKKRLWELPLPEPYRYLLFLPDTPESPIPTTDYTDCGFQQWCIQEKCVEKRTGWYQSHDLKLEGMADPWVERKVDELPCLKKKADREFLSEIEAKFQECNRETCQNENATYGLLVKFYHCDRPTPDKTIGVRMDYCVGEPMKVFPCHRCDPSPSIAPFMDCDPVKDNGVQCYSELGVCFYGICHMVDTTYLE